MTTDLYWIPGPWSGRLAIMPRPRGGDWLDDEVTALKRGGVGALVSLLTADEVADLDVAGEERLCRANDIEFVSLPIPDRGVPGSAETIEELVGRVSRLLSGGKAVAIHCRQGIGRAGLVAACLLINAETEPNQAIKQVGSARQVAIPETDDQRKWIIAWAERRQSSPQLPRLPEEVTTDNLPSEWATGPAVGNEVW